MPLACSKEIRYQMENCLACRIQFENKYFSIQTMKSELACVGWYVDPITWPLEK